LRIGDMLDKAKLAFIRQASPSEINAILLQLSGYALAHFREEEQLMLSYAFPGFAEHKQEHDSLATSVRGLLDIRSKQDALRCAVSTLHLWLGEHIRTSDKEFHNFVRPGAMKD
jgi:hemerythrin